MKFKKIKICHLTSVHNRFDVRIFFKMCKSLSLQGYDVSLIVADNLGNEVKNGVSIFDVGKMTNGRLLRMIKTVRFIFNKAKKLDSDIYHLHDPELIPIGLKLKSLGKKVIFDVHENIPLDILEKEYIPPILRKVTSFLYKKYEKRSLKQFDALILAENSYLKYYSSFNRNIKVVQNMPDLNQLNKFKNYNRNKNEIFYIGDISNARGFDIIIESLKILKNKIPNIFMHCVGNYDKKYLQSIDFKKINQNIKFYGELPLPKGLEYSKNAKVGISILKPLQNYIESYSTKIFEYMAIGLPVITSNFKLYKNVIEKYNCGICVNPFDPFEIAEACTNILRNNILSTSMTLNGIDIVKNNFNWEIEKKKLLCLYKNL